MEFSETIFSFIILCLVPQLSIGMLSEIYPGRSKYVILLNVYTVNLMFVDYNTLYYYPLCTLSLSEMPIKIFFFTKQTKYEKCNHIWLNMMCLYVLCSLYCTMNVFMIFHVNIIYFKKLLKKYSKTFIGVSNNNVIGTHSFYNYR